MNLVSETLHQYLDENKSSMPPKIGFKQEYFDLPYQIPENRFEDGILKGVNDKFNTKFKRQFKQNYSQLKYKDVEDYAKKINLKEIQIQINTDVQKVIDFIKNNPLSGKLLKAKFIKNEDLKHYIELQIKTALDPNDNWYEEPIGFIEMNLKDSFGITVDYDIYKGCTVFTFDEDALFYYYTVFTLSRNDVVGSGEDYTYITENDFKNQMFYETIWRHFMNECNPNEADPDILSQIKTKNRIQEMLDDFYLNYSLPVVDNYLDPGFVKLFRHFIKTGEKGTKQEKLEKQQRDKLNKQKHDPNNPKYKKMSTKIKPKNDWYAGHPEVVFDKEFGWVEPGELYLINNKRGLIWDHETQKWIPASDKMGMKRDLWTGKWVKE